MTTRALALLLLAAVLVPTLPAAVGGGGGGGGGGGYGGGGGAQVGGSGGNGGVQKYDPNDPNNPNHNADEQPSSVVGTAFDVVVTIDGKKRRGRVTFARDKVSSELFGTLAFTEKQGKNLKAPVSFDASSKDSKGNPVGFTGRVTEDELSGTITMTPPKAEKPEDIPVVGGRVGTDAARKALATMDEKKKAEKK